MFFLLWKCFGEISTKIENPNLYSYGFRENNEKTLCLIIATILTVHSSVTRNPWLRTGYKHDFLFIFVSAWYNVEYGGISSIALNNTSVFRRTAKLLNVFASKKFINRDIVPWKVINATNESASVMRTIAEVAAAAAAVTETTKTTN